MKKLVSLMLALMLVMTSVASFAAPATSATQHTAQYNVYIEGNVGKYVPGTSLMLTLTKGTDVVYISEYDTVKADGSYAIKFKHTGDLNGANVNVRYGAEDVTSSAVAATATTAILEADVFVTDKNDRNFDLAADQSMPSYTHEDYKGGGYMIAPYVYKSDYVFEERDGLKAVVNLKNKFAYDTKVDLVVAAYDKNKKLLDCKIKEVEVAYGENGEMIVGDTAVIAVPAGTEYAKAFCWSSVKDLIPMGKEADDTTLPKVDVFCIGDSTGQDWPNNEYYFNFPQAGWGTYLKDYLNSDFANVINLCRSGAWAQSIMNNPDDKSYGGFFPGGGIWDNMEARADYNEGDYVIVCLGINDNRRGDINDQYTDVEWYGMAIEEMAKRTAARGVNLIIAAANPSVYRVNNSPMTRFDEKGKEIADKYGLPFIDHASEMIKVFKETGDGSVGYVAKVYFLDRETAMADPAKDPLGYGVTQVAIDNHANGALKTGGSGMDDTHLGIRGANLVCQKMIEVLKDSTSNLRFYIK